MGLFSHWKERKQFLGRVGSKRSVWWLVLLLALVLYLIYQLGRLDQFISN